MGPVDPAVAGRASRFRRRSRWPRSPHASAGPRPSLPPLTATSPRPQAVSGVHPESSPISTAPRVGHSSGPCEIRGSAPRTRLPAHPDGPRSPPPPAPARPHRHARGSDPQPHTPPSPPRLQSAPPCKAEFFPGSSRAQGSHKPSSHAAPTNHAPRPPRPSPPFRRAGSPRDDASPPRFPPRLSRSPLPPQDWVPCAPPLFDPPARRAASTFHHRSPLRNDCDPVPPQLRD